MTGTIFDIKRFAVHDGPGIRTTLFMKGCPLNCLWCHNPESILPQAESAERIFKVGERPFKEQEIIGRKVSVKDIIPQLLRDKVFMEMSGGGVTFSGGEPLMQPRFLAELLTACRSEGLHTAVDTCGMAPRATLLDIAGKADLLLYDLKVMDDELHRKYTSESNQEILKNLLGVAKTRCAIRLRIPLIPGVSDTKENLSAVIAFLKPIRQRITGIDLLPSHQTATGKYAALKRKMPLDKLNPIPEEHLTHIKEQLITAGHQTTIGG